MVGICYGLEQAKLICRDLGLIAHHIGICSDNQSVIDICVGDSSTDSIKMIKLLESIDRLCEGSMSVSFQWVRGHASNTYNNMADKLAYSILKG